MKLKFFIFLLVLSALVPIFYVKAAAVPKSLKGQILIQVEDKGQAWYVNPKDNKRYYMADGNEALQIMKTLGIGMSSKDIEKMKTDASYRKKFIGKILLQVESRGEAYYISSNGRYNYLKDGASAYEVMKKLGLGVSNKDLTKIAISKTAANSQSESVGNNNSILDCGLSDQSIIKKLSYEQKETSGTSIQSIPDLSKDKSFTCMGKALLNNCQKATVKVKGAGGTTHTEEILGGDNDNCNLKVTYGKVKETDVEQKKYENSYLQCAYPRSVLKDSGCFMLSDKACNFFGVKNSPAYIYNNGTANMVLAALFSPTEIKCSGNMTDKVKSFSANTSNQNSNLIK